MTGPTQRQVVEIAMGEVARAFTAATDLPGELYQSALRLGREERRGLLAFVSSDVSRLTGFHAPRILVIVTEAQGVPEFTWEGIFACATGDEDRVLAVGNPIAPTGRFFQAFRSPTWTSISISAFEHPNLREGKVVIPGGPTAVFAERIAQEYGEGSGTYRARVLGEFPEEHDEGLLKRAWLDAAVERWEDPELIFGKEPLVVACDPARYGPDQTAVAVRRGSRLEVIHTWRGNDTSETAKRVLGIVDELPGSAVAQVLTDTIGVGAGVHDALRAARNDGRHLSLSEFNAGASANEKDRFLNARAESFWKLRTRLEDGSIALPRDEKLIDELLAIRWFATSDGKVQIEAKDQIRARLGRSPDRADATAMAFSRESFQGGCFAYIGGQIWDVRTCKPVERF